MQPSVIIPLNTGDLTGVITKELPGLGYCHPVGFIPVTPHTCHNEPKIKRVAPVAADLLRRALTGDGTGPVEVELSSRRDQGFGPRFEFAPPGGRLSASKW